MSQDQQDHHLDDPEPEGGPPGPSSAAEDAPPGEDEDPSEGGSLPPPAFPPGAKRRAVRDQISLETWSSGGAAPEIPDEAYISPDDPIRTRGRGIPNEAFISPDDPLVPPGRDEEGHVTGLGLSPIPMSEAGSSRRQKPTIHELPYLLDQLAEKLHDSGEKALEVNTEMGHFQAALRSFLRGYLEGSGD